MNSAQHRLDSFNFFRVTGAILIFLCHITFFNTHIEGGVSVELFFILSGFGMTIGYGNTNSKFIPFMQKRLKRLYPIYFITLLMGMLYMLLVLDHSIFPTLIKLPAFLLCAQTITPLMSPTGFNSPGWYVATLIWIYIFFYWFTRNSTNFKWIILSIFAITIITIQIIMPSSEIKTWLFYFSPYYRIIDFFIGVLTAKIYIRHPKCLASKSIMTFLEAIALTIFLLCVIYETRFAYSYQYGVLIAIVLYIFSMQKGYISHFFCNPIFKYPSDCSYAFYLVHYIIIMTFVKELHIQYGFTVYNLLMTLIMFIISSLLAILLNKYSSKIKLPNSHQA